MYSSVFRGYAIADVGDDTDDNIEQTEESRVTQLNSLCQV